MSLLPTSRDCCCPTPTAEEAMLFETACPMFLLSINDASSAAYRPIRQAAQELKI